MNERIKQWTQDRKALEENYRLYLKRRVIQASFRKYLQTPLEEEDVVPPFS